MNQKSANSNIAAIAAVAVVVAGLLLIVVCGCGRTQKSEPISVIEAFDGSLSNRHNLPSQVLAGARYASELPDASRLTLDRFDFENYQFYSGNPPESRSQLQDMIVTNLKKLPQEDGTKTVDEIQSISQRFGKATRSTVILIFTDADLDDQSQMAHNNLAAAAAALYANKNIVFVGFVESAPKNAEQWKKLFADLDQDGRLGFLLCDQVDSATINDKGGRRL